MGRGAAAEEKSFRTSPEASAMKLAVTKEHTKANGNAVRVKQGRRAGTGTVCGNQFL